MPTLNDDFEFKFTIIPREILHAQLEVDRQFQEWLWRYCSIPAELLEPSAYSNHLYNYEQARREWQAMLREHVAVFETLVTACLFEEMRAKAVASYLVWLIRRNLVQGRHN